jgi:hypothetical protein
VLSKEEAEAKLLLDSRQAAAADRVARALVTRETIQLGTELEAHWKINLSDVTHWSGQPETLVKVPANDPMGDQVRPCPYQRYSMAWVEVLLDATGALVSVSILRTSGSPSRDASLTALVQSRQPFLPPRPRDLDRRGLSRTVWDFGIEDFSRSTCKPLSGPAWFKDVRLRETNLETRPSAGP